MKLQNKKTRQEGNFIINKDHFECVDLDYVPLYFSLSELLDEWEDYKPNYKPTKPLIKDEKIRRAVRAWAEVQGLTEVYCASNGYEIYGGDDDLGIQFEGEPFSFADRNRTYTIDELCGEEEE